MAAIPSKDKRGNETILKKDTWKGGAPPWPLSQTKYAEYSNWHGERYLKGGRAANNRA